MGGPCTKKKKMMLNRQKFAILIINMLHFWLKMLKNPMIVVHLVIVPAQ